MTSGEESEAYVILREGKFHQIKRMLAYLGKPVLYLERVRMGNLLLDPVLERGAYRLLTKEGMAGISKTDGGDRKTSKLQQKGKRFFVEKRKNILQSDKIIAIMTLLTDCTIGMRGQALRDP